MAALLAGLARGWAPAFTEQRIIVTAAAGALVGIGYSFVSPPPPGPLPELLQGGMCTALLLLTVFATLSGKRVWAWLFAWLLAILSMRVDVAGPAARVSLLALCLCTLGAAALAQWERVRLTRAALVGLAVFLSAAAAATWAAERGLDASQGTLVSLIGGALDELGTRMRADFEMPTNVAISGFSNLPDSKRPLFEVDGAIPTHLRGVILDRFDGRVWSTSAQTESQALDLRSLAPPANPIRSTALFYASLGERLPSPAGVRAVQGARAQARGGWGLSGSDLRGLTVDYTWDGAHQLPPEPEPGPEVAQLPAELKAALRPIAEEIVKGASTPRARARAIEQHLQQNFTYSLRADLSGRDHPLVVLLKERRPAYCTYFASAMAALMRSLDVPARLVGGFVTEDPNPLTHKAMVRARDAHAWVEVWLEDEGRFAAFDPTPFDSRDRALGVEHGAGSVILEALGAALNAAFAAFRRSPGEFFQRLLLSPWLWGLIGLLVLWRVVARVRYGKVVRPRAAMECADARLRALYARYLKILRARAGIEPAPAETDEAVLARLERAGGPTAAAQRFLERYRQARYRAAPWDAGSVGAALDELERALVNR